MGHSSHHTIKSKGKDVDQSDTSVLKKTSHVKFNSLSITENSLEDINNDNKGAANNEGKASVKNQQSMEKLQGQKNTIEASNVAVSLPSTFSNAVRNSMISSPRSKKIGSVKVSEE